MSALPRVTYVGHATVLLELDGVRLLTDPVLRPRVLHLRRSGAVRAETSKRIDAVLVSHAHWDHLDMRSLARLGRDVRLVVPRGVGRLVRRRGFADVVELDVAGRVEVGPLAISATRAEHDGRRGPFGVDAPALGYVVAGSRRVYFAGDTDLYPEMSELAPLDLALIPVAGWGPRLPPGHLDPRRAAEALALLQPRAVVPIHWGTYSVMTLRPRRPGSERAPADEFARLASELAPEVRVHVLAPGESLELE
jgi:L-ascorbate metabolism protein UlaG (beta-lactamase superfamily)